MKRKTHEDYMRGIDAACEHAKVTLEDALLDQLASRYKPGYSACTREGWCVLQREHVDQCSPTFKAAK